MTNTQFDLPTIFVGRDFREEHTRNQHICYNEGISGDVLMRAAHFKF